MLPGFSGDLAELTLVGVGHLQRVYVHPHDRSRCIKVMRAEIAGTPAEKRYRTAARREHAYHAFLAGRGVAYTHLAKYHGRMRIEHGGHAQSAGVFDLIRNDSGEISRTLSVELETGQGELADAVHELYAYVLRYRIISGWKMQNIVVQRLSNAPPKCVLIDNLGNSDFIPLADYADWFARMKIRRRYLKFLQGAPEKTPNCAMLVDALRKASKKTW